MQLTFDTMTENTGIRQTLSLCMIVRNSSRTLGACLDSIAPWVDELIVVDTGSVDDTKEIALQFGAKLYEFPWRDDFSAARNESLRHAMGDWLFWMDSDDTISEENGKRLRELVDQALETAPMAFVMQVHCPGSRDKEDVTVVDHVKLFRNDSRIRFEGRIHEQVLPSLRACDAEIAWTDIFVTHSGSDHSPAGRRRKQQRDLRLLELELADRPEHPFVLFNLGMTYADMNDDAQAIEYLKRCLHNSSAEESHVRKAYALLVSCLVRLEKDEEAMRIVTRGRELFPDDAELSFRQGILFQRAHRYEEAIDAYERAVEDREERHFSSRDWGITGHKARHNLASVYREMKRLDMEELQWRLALDDRPEYRSAWRGLTESLLQQQKFATLEVEIENMRSFDSLEREAACSTVLRSNAMGETDLAKEQLKEALSRWPNDLELLSFGCDFLFHHGEPAECLEPLKTLCALAPNDASAWHNLGSAQQRAGDNRQAACCFRRSLELRPDSPATMLQLGFAQLGCGNVEAARATWQRALEIDTANTAVRLALDDLEKREQVGSH